MYLFLKVNSMNLVGLIRLLTFLASPINNKRLRPLKTLQIIPILVQSKIRIPQIGSPYGRMEPKVCCGVNWL